MSDDRDDSLPPEGSDPPRPAQAGAIHAFELRLDRMNRELDSQRGAIGTVSDALGDVQATLTRLESVVTYMAVRMQRDADTKDVTAQEIARLDVAVRRMQSDLATARALERARHQQGNEDHVNGTGRKTHPSGLNYEDLGETQRREAVAAMQQAIAELQVELKFSRSENAQMKAELEQRRESTRYWGRYAIVTAIGFAVLISAGYVVHRLTTPAVRQTIEVQK